MKYEINKELRKEYRKYAEELSNKNCIIAKPDKLMEKLCEPKPTRIMKIYVTVVMYGFKLMILFIIALIIGVPSVLFILILC